MKSRKEEEPEEATNEKTTWMVNGINPCLIPHVTDQLMKYLLPDTKVLKQARLVCKDWSVCASQSLRKVTRARIGEHCTNVAQLSKFLSLVETHGMNLVSVTDFTFCQDVFQPDNEDAIKKFFVMCHSILESFTVWFDLKSTLPFGNEGFLFTSPFSERDKLLFPKLRHIEWDDRRSQSSLNNNLSSFENSGPKLLEWLLSRCPNLQSLSIHFESQHNLHRGDEPPNDEVEECLIRILSREGPLKPSNLKSLKLDVEISDKLLETLSELFIDARRLSSLTICVRGSHFLPESFTNMLTSVKDQLVELRILSLCDKSNCVIRFPELLRKLRVLEISGWNVGSGIVRFDAFCLPRNFPAIKSLVLDCWADKPDWWQFVGAMGHANGTVESLEELVLPEEIVCSSRIPEILKVFPNLRKLDLPVSSEEIEVLQVVFKVCTGLTDLTVRRSSNGWMKSKNIVDHVFTGIPSDICTKLSRSKSLNVNNKFSVLKQSVDALRTKPGLTNLKNLKRLEVKDLQYLVELTDVTGNFAFLEMECLEYLNCGRSLMSPKCLSKLSEKFPQNMAYQATLERISPAGYGERCDDENYSLRDIRKCTLL